MRRFVATAIVGSILACGARTELSSVAIVEDAGLTRDAGSAAGPDDAGSVNDTGLPVDGADGATPRVGLLWAAGATPGLGPDYVWSAFFPEGTSPACAFIGDRGTCAVATCPTFSSAPSASAGTIVASSGSASATLTYTGTPPSGAYPMVRFDGPLLPGDAIRFQSAGGVDVPAFDLTALAPPPVGLSPFPFQPGTKIDATEDLPLSWSTSSLGDAIFTLVAPSGELLACFFDGGAGTGVVPKTELATLKARTRGTLDASFFVATRVKTSVAGWQLQATVRVLSGVQQSGPVSFL